MSLTAPGVLSSLSVKEKEELEGEEGEKRDMNFCVRLNLRLLMGLGVVVGDAGGGAVFPQS